MGFVDKLKSALVHRTIMAVGEGAPLAGCPTCDILFEDEFGRLKVITLVSRQVGDSFENTFDMAAEVTEPRPASRRELKGEPSSD